MYKRQGGGFAVGKLGGINALATKQSPGLFLPNADAFGASCLLHLSLIHISDVHTGVQHAATPDLYKGACVRAVLHGTVRQLHMVQGLSLIHISS